MIEGVLWAVGFAGVFVCGLVVSDIKHQLDNAWTCIYEMQDRIKRLEKK